MQSFSVSSNLSSAYVPVTCSQKHNEGSVSTVPSYLTFSSPERSSFHILSDILVTIHSMGQVLCKALGIQREVQTIPAFKERTVLRSVEGIVEWQTQH